MSRSSDDSPLQRISAESCLLGSAGYAVLLQVAHPAVAQGVHDHSNFSARPFDRLLGTLYFVYGSIYGTEEEQKRLHDIVRAMHRKVNGPGYRALDHELLLWVAATLFHSATRMYTIIVREPDKEEYAASLRDASVFATALGLPQEKWPASPEAFETYWAESLERLQPEEVARGISQKLFHPEYVPLRPLMKVQLLLTGGLLPPDLRERFGIPWSDARQRRFDRIIRVTRAVYPRVPRPVRTLPATLCLWSMRRNGGWLKPRRSSSKRPLGPKRASGQKKAPDQKGSPSSTGKVS